MKVLLLTRYCETGASSRLRALQYVPYLRSVGIEVESRPLFNKSYLDELYDRGQRSVVRMLAAYIQRAKHLQQSKLIDLLWIEKELFPYLPWCFEQALGGLRNIPSAVDYDDAVFHAYDMHASSLVRATLGNKIDHVMNSASLVIAGNSYLAERASNAGARMVATIFTVVVIERYRLREEKKRNGPLTIGWIGSPTTAPYLRPIESALEQIQEKSSAKITLVGAVTSPFKKVQVEILAWTLNDEVERIHSFDIGVMPLPEGPWERGKCGYKLIQYMACGLPVIASPVGANCEIIEHGVNGLLAETPEQWSKAFESLRANPDLRRRLGDAGRKTVETSYCTAVTAPRVAELLRRAAHLQRGSLPTQPPPA